MRKLTSPSSEMMGLLGGNGRTGPDPHMPHQCQNAFHQLVAVVFGNPHSHAHFHHKGRCTDAVEGIGQRGFQHGGSSVNPDKVHIQLSGIGHQRIPGQCVNPHLRDLPQENIAGMDVDHHVAAGQVLHNSGGDIFRHGAVLLTGENPVHIQIKGRDAPGNGVDAQRIQRRIHIHDPRQMLRVLPNPTLELIAHILPLQLIPMGAGHNADPLFTAPKPSFGYQPVFLNPKSLIQRKPHGYHCLYHTFSFFPIPEDLFVFAARFQFVIYNR